MPEEMSEKERNAKIEARKKKIADAYAEELRSPVDLCLDSEYQFGLDGDIQVTLPAGTPILRVTYPKIPATGTVNGREVEIKGGVQITPKLLDKMLHGSNLKPVRASSGPPVPEKIGK